MPIFSFGISQSRDADISLELRPLKEKAIAPAKGHLTLHVTLERAAAEASTNPEDVRTQPDGPEAPATADRIFKAGDTVVAVGNNISANWTMLQPLAGLLKSTKLNSLVKAVDDLAKVRVKPL